MAYQKYWPEQVLVEERVWNLPWTQEILTRLDGVPVRKIHTVEEEAEKAREAGLSPAEARKTLVLARQSGKFLKPCPGTQNYVCCGYYFLNVATNCDVNCTYCILQGYLNIPFMVVYTNIEDAFRELDGVLGAVKFPLYRIGTGELTDSLTLEHITHMSERLVPYFAEKKNAILELKTKTTQIDWLLSLDHRRKVIVAWSLNPDAVIQAEEKNAPSLAERLSAAQKVEAAGYRLAFHFDPMIHYPDWESGYREVVERLFDAVHPENIAWISLGALRYPAPMDRVIRENHPESRIVLGELVPGKDGKLRYFRPIRQQMFRKMIDWVKARAPQVTLYFCMESPEVWAYAFREQVLHKCPLPKLLDKSVFDWVK
jgi:spore photoproduct lyase